MPSTAEWANHNLRSWHSNKSQKKHSLKTNWLTKQTLTACEFMLRRCLSNSEPQPLFIFQYIEITISFIKEDKKWSINFKLSLKSCSKKKKGLCFLYSLIVNQSHVLRLKSLTRVYSHASSSVRLNYMQTSACFHVHNIIYYHDNVKLV